MDGVETREKRAETPSSWPGRQSQNIRIYPSYLLSRDKLPQNLWLKTIILLIFLGVGWAQLDNYCSGSLMHLQLLGLASSEGSLTDSLSCSTWAGKPQTPKAPWASLSVFTWSLRMVSPAWQLQHSQTFFKVVQGFKDPCPKWDSQMESVFSFLTGPQKSRQSQRSTQVGGEETDPTSWWEVRQRICRCVLKLPQDFIDLWQKVWDRIVSHSLNHKLVHCGSFSAVVEGYCHV